MIWEKLNRGTQVENDLSGYSVCHLGNIYQPLSGSGVLPVTLYSHWHLYDVPEELSSKIPLIGGVVGRRSLISSL